jgi:hypothetical protein
MEPETIVSLVFAGICAAGVPPGLWLGWKAYQLSKAALALAAVQQPPVVVVHGPRKAGGPEPSPSQEQVHSSDLIGLAL